MARARLTRTISICASIATSWRRRAGRVVFGTVYLVGGGDGGATPFEQLFVRAAVARADAARWEESHMNPGGAMSTKELARDFLDEAMARAHLLVPSVPAAAISRERSYSKAQEPVIPIKDCASDMAVMSRKGSALLRQLHERERERARAGLGYTWDAHGRSAGRSQDL